MAERAHKVARHQEEGTAGPAMEYDLANFEVNEGVFAGNSLFDQLSDDELKARLRLVLTAERTRLSDLSVLASTNLHPKIVQLLTTSHATYCDAVLEFTARESKILLLSILEGEKLGSNHFAIGPLPKCAGELCYGILARVPAQKDLSAAHSLSRLSFQAIGLRIGASAADAETRPLVAHETSKALQSVAFKRLPPDLATVLVPQQIGSIVFVPSEAVEEKKLSYISFAAEASIISAGGLHHNRLEAPAGPVALSPNFVALTTRAGGCGPRQGPRPDLQVARDSTAVAFPALIGFARWVGGQLLAATRDSDRVIFATLSTVRPSLILRPDPLVNLAFAPGCKLDWSQRPCSEWEIPLEVDFHHKLVLWYKELAEPVLSTFGVGFRPDGIVLCAAFEDDLIEIPLDHGHIGEQGWNALALIAEHLRTE
ncbi:hypothetical protein B0A53_05749 [Rhodotorula sp. CCFEE 5036]|nr:hypothetical protein B0A53_05749 [Rhodotorula sp. CCFEE 5036]